MSDTEKLAEKLWDMVHYHGSVSDVEKVLLEWQAARQAPASGEVEPDWSDSKTLESEGWKNPLLSKNDRLQIADGAVTWRDEVIKTCVAVTPSPPSKGVCRRGGRRRRWVQSVLLMTQKWS